MLKEFREFIMRGNVLDLAVAVIMGAAFGAVVNSLVNDILMPPIGKLLGGVDFANFFVKLSDHACASVAACKEAGVATINYGVFINLVITFLIVSFVIFVIVRTANQLKRKPEAAIAAPTTTTCPYCCSTIPIQATRCAFCTSEVIAAVKA